MQKKKEKQHINLKQLVKRLYLMGIFFLFSSFLGSVVLATDVENEEDIMDTSSMTDPSSTDSSESSIEIDTSTTSNSSSSSSDFEDTSTSFSEPSESLSSDTIPEFSTDIRPIIFPSDIVNQEENKVENYEYAVTKTTQEFIEVIGEDARRIAYENDLYASVMIAQAILESGSGNSALSQAPNYNLFGIKGTYRGQSVSMMTMEDDGTGKLYSIQSVFRKYPGYTESLEDYAQLLTGKGNSLNSTFYYGVRKSYAKDYQKATAFLTGRYATDTNYDKKLNGIIEAYNLTQYDNPKDTELSNDLVFQQKICRIHQGETLWDISTVHEVPVNQIVEFNSLSESTVYIGQELVLDSEVNESRDDFPDYENMSMLDEENDEPDIQQVMIDFGQRLTKSVKKEFNQISL